MKICILSDTHDRVDYLHAALEMARTQGVEVVLHCGDVVAPYTLKRTREFGLPIHVIHGNNKGDLAVLCQLAHDPDSLIHYHGRDARIALGGRSIFMVHFPEYAQAIALTGEHDLVCCGHNHRCKIETVTHASGDGTTLLVNPGSASGMGNIQPTCAIGDLETMKFEILDVPEPPPPDYKRCG